MDETLPEPLPYSQETPPLAMSSPQVINSNRNPVLSSLCSTPINKNSRWRPARCGILEEEEDVPLTSSQTTSILNKITQNCNEFEVVWSSPTRERHLPVIPPPSKTNALSLSRNKCFRPKYASKSVPEMSSSSGDPPKETVKLKPILLPVCYDLDNSMDCSSTDNELLFNLAEQNTIKNEAKNTTTNDDCLKSTNFDIDVENLFLDDSSFDCEMLKCSQEVEQKLFSNNNTKTKPQSTPQRSCSNKTNETPNRLSKILANFEDSMDDDCLSSLPIDDLLKVGPSTSFSRHNSMPETPGRSSSKAAGNSAQSVNGRSTFSRHSSMPHQNSLCHASAGSSSGASSCSDSIGPSHSPKRICTQKEIALKRQQALQRLKAANQRKLKIRSTSSGGFPFVAGAQR